MNPLAPRIVVARLPFDERMQVVLEWLGISLIAFAVILILAYRYPRKDRALHRMSLRTLRKRHAKGEISLADYEQELARRQGRKAG